jgi:ankyrin repeat protein
MAVKRGHMASVIRLLELGANPNLTDLQGFNSLHLAAYLGNLPVVEALISGIHGELIFWIFLDIFL